MDTDHLLTVHLHLLVGAISLSLISLQSGKFSTRNNFFSIPRVAQKFSFQIGKGSAPSTQFLLTLKNVVCMRGKIVV